MNVIYLLTVFMFTCCSTNVQNKQQNKHEGINVVDSLIEPFYTDSTCLAYIANNQFNEDEIIIDKQTKVILQHFEKWPEPGYYLRGKVISNNDTLKLLNCEGWVTFKGYQLKELVRKKNIIESEKVLVVKLTPNFKYIFLLGPSYGSQPGTVTIISSNKSRSSIIFHKHFKLMELKDIDNDGCEEIVGITSYNKNKVFLKVEGELVSIFDMKN